MLTFVLLFVGNRYTQNTISLICPVIAALFIVQHETPQVLTRITDCLQMIMVIIHVNEKITDLDIVHIPFIQTIWEMRAFKYLHLKSNL